ncbi:beta strand repeat-containing protein [Mesorhizobium sp. IMUNJ 23232]|uniref:beta strand repeat-containing protein n=1 Tax=Mesorhizobium sp. IMUNJ 23232 TaxID=3376064 RepID=UPI003789E87F
MPVFDGDNGNDLLGGGSGADTLNGFGGDDILRGLGGADALDGGEGIDTADYSASSAAVFIDRINGTAEGGDAQGDGFTSVENFIGSGLGDGFLGDNGANRIDGGSGNDTIFGLGGNDVLIGGFGGDIIGGGDGIDSADYQNSDVGVIIDLLNGTASGGHAAGDIITGIENLRGSVFGDMLNGDNADNRLEGSGGEDIISGLGGNDRLFGGTDFDTLSGGDQNDFLTGGGGSDVLDGGAGIDAADYSTSFNGVTVKLTGGLGDSGFGAGGDADGDFLIGIENIQGSLQDDTLEGDTLANAMNGLTGDDTLRGLAGNDVLAGQVGSDTIDGGEGIDTAAYDSSGAGVTISLLLAIAQSGDAQGDTLINIENVNGSGFADIISGDGADNRLLGLNGSDELNGFSGNDALDGGGGIDRLSGGDGDDTLVGGADGDDLFGDDDNDILVGGAGADHLNGGDGFDIADYSASSAGVDVSLSEDTTTTRQSRAVALNAAEGGDAEGDILNNIEQVIGSAFSDNLDGDAGANKLIGGDSGDTLDGFAGSDTLDGGAGGDILRGGEGNDLYIVTATDSIIEAAGEGTADRAAALESFTLGNGDNIEILSTANTKLTTAINLTGNTLKQEILGNAGFNILHTGGGAADVMKGLGGDDIYRVFNSGDVVVETAGNGSDTVVTAVDYKLSASAEIENMFTNGSTGTSAIDLTGNALRQEIAGNAGANILHDGGAGAADVMRGFGGNDTYRVFNVGDILIELASEGTADKVIAAVDYKLGTGVQVEILQTNGSTGTSAIDLTGNEFGQQITGNAGANRIEGKGGIDTLRGGSGADTFVFASTLGAANVDKILDFSVPADRMLLSDAIFTALDTGTLSAAAFRVNNTGLAQDTSDHIIYERDSGKLFYDADGVGGSAGIHFATLTVGLALTNADFSVA